MYNFLFFSAANKTKHIDNNKLTGLNDLKVSGSVNMKDTDDK